VSLHRLVWIMLATVLRVVLRPTLRVNLTMYLRLILDELNVGNLRFVWRWYQKEKRQNEQRSHERKVAYIRATGCLG
jgi:hypothetical protein